MYQALMTGTNFLKDTYIGQWSPYTLLLSIFMIFAGLILAIALLILALMGRLRTTPPPQDETFDPIADGDEALPSMDKALKRSQKDALKKAALAGKPAAPKRKTGWLHLIVAVLCGVASVIVFRWVDNPYGRMHTFTFGTALNFLLMILQVYLAIRVVLYQRRLPR